MAQDMINMNFLAFFCHKYKCETSKEMSKVVLALSLKPVKASCIEENWMTFISLNDENIFMYCKFKVKTTGINIFI